MNRLIDGHYWSEVWPLDHATKWDRLNAYQHIGKVRSDDYQKELEYIQFLQRRGFQIFKPGGR